MKINKLINYLLVGLMIAALTSCQKENIDNTTTEEEEVTQVVTCDDWTMTIVDDMGANGNGNLSPISDGGTAPYLYLWSTGDTLENITVNFEGAYSLTITDSEGCTVSDTIAVEFNDPCNGLFAQLTQMTDTVTTITSVVTGGTAPFAYQWSTGEGTESIVVTSNGTYSLTVIDANGCVYQTQTVVDSNNNNLPCDGFALTLAEQPPGSGDIYTAVSGGTPPYLYSWSTGETTSNITVDSSGIYSISITDANGCIVFDSIAL